MKLLIINCFFILHIYLWLSLLSTPLQCEQLPEQPLQLQPSLTLFFMFLTSIYIASAAINTVIRTCKFIKSPHVLKNH